MIAVQVVRANVFAKERPELQKLSSKYLPNEYCQVSSDIGSIGVDTEHTLHVDHMKMESAIPGKEQEWSLM